MNELNWLGRDCVWRVSHYFGESKRSLCRSKKVHHECTRFPSSGGTFTKCAECLLRLKRKEAKQ
jgi:hypothetical protein